MQMLMATMTSQHLRVITMSVTFVSLCQLHTQFKEYIFEILIMISLKYTLAIEKYQMYLLT